MRLSDFFEANVIVRDCSFKFTMFPSTSLPGSVCYALTEPVIATANKNSNIQAIITTEGLAPLVENKKGLVVVEKPHESYYQLHNFVIGRSSEKLVGSGKISGSARIASSSIIGENVIIEDGVEIAHNVIVNENTIIMKGTYIGENVVLGAKGMQNIYVGGEYFRIEYGGGVSIGKNCEILANAIIQRPYHFFFTTIGRNSKISVKVSIGHGSAVGDNCMIAGNGTIAGNVSIGNNVWIGPSVTIADGLTVADNSRLLIGSVLVNNVVEARTLSGNFALEHSKHLRNFSKLKKL